MVTNYQAEAGTHTPPRAARWAVATIFFANGTVLANWLARIPDAKQRLGLSDGALGVTLLAAAVGALLAQPAMGVFIGRFGSRGATTGAALAFCCSMALPGFAPNMPLLMLGLLVLGACNGGLDVAMNAQATLVERQYGRTIINSFHGLWSLGGLAGASIGGFATQHFALGPHLLIAGLIGLPVMALASRWLLPDSGDPDAEGFKLALPPRALLPLGIIAFCALVSEGVVSDWSGVYLRETLGSSPGLGAAAFATFSLCMAAGRLTGDWLTHRFGPTRLMIGGGVLTVICALLIVGAPMPLVAIVGFGILGLALACLFPLVLSAASRTPGIVPSMGIAAMATVGYTGFLAGPPLIGAVATFLSLRVALGLLAVFGVAIIVCGRVANQAKGDGLRAN